MIKKKNNYDVTTKACSLTDNAVDEKGATAYTTFATEDKEYSNDYIIPFHSICEVKVKLSQESVEIDDPTCQNGDEPAPPTPGEPRIDGATNTSINQGTDFDLNEGVKAYDGEGNEIPFTVTPSEVAKCEVGEQKFTYSAEGVTKERTITVKQIANPTINGLTELTVDVGEEFDPLEGVTGVDGNGKTIPVTLEEQTYPYLYGTVGSADVEVPDYQYSEELPMTIVAENPSLDGLQVELRIKNFYVELGDSEERRTVYFDHEDMTSDVGMLYGNEIWFFLGKPIPDIVHRKENDGTSVIFVGSEGPSYGTYSWDSVEMWVVGETE